VTRPPRAPGRGPAGVRQLRVSCADRVGDRQVQQEHAANHRNRGYDGRWKVAEDGYRDQHDWRVCQQRPRGHGRTAQPAAFERLGHHQCQHGARTDASHEADTSAEQQKGQHQLSNASRGTLATPMRSARAPCVVTVPAKIQRSILPVRAGGPASGLKAILVTLRHPA
jgi:hypothetical protein